MPFANDIDLSKQLLRTVIWGEAKTRKTFWACMAAEAGFNVILIDGDDGSQIVRQLPSHVQPKVLVVDVRDLIDRAVFKEFCATFVRAKSFLWNEQTRLAEFRDFKAENSYIRFTPSKFTPNDVVIFDSWKAFTQSTLLSFAMSNELDLSDAEKEEWDGYGFQGRFQDFVLKSLHCLRCHVIVIGHSCVYEKWDRRDKKNPKLLSRKTQLVSSSGPHAGTMWSNFTDILYVERIGPTNFMIDTAGEMDRVGGSRLLEPRKYQWDKLPVTDLLSKIGAKATGEKSTGAEWISSGADIQAASTAAPVLGTPVIPNRSTGSILAKLTEQKVG